MNSVHIVYDKGTYNCMVCGEVVHFDGSIEAPPPCPVCGRNLYVKSFHNPSRLTKVRIETNASRKREAIMERV